MQMQKAPYLIFFVLLTTLARAKSANVLGVFPHFGFSHFKVVQPILFGLAQRGHNVTVLSYVRSTQTPHANYEELLLDASTDQTERTINVADLEQFSAERTVKSMLTEYFHLHASGEKSCALLYASKHVELVLARHQQTPYDVFFTEYFNTDCQLGIAHILQVPVVALSTCALMPWYYDRINLPDTPSYVQSEFIGFAEPLELRERLLNFVQAKVLKQLYRYRTNSHDNAVIRKHLQIDVHVDEVAITQTALIFANQHYTLLGSRPSSPQLVEIGGVHIEQREMNATLPADIANFLAEAKQGVIFISWGSMLRAKSIEKRKLNAMLAALKAQPQKVIWKWESDELPIDSAQFLFVKWAPQLTLLCHPRVKLFWSHAGLLGTTESLHCGKPLLLTPIYGDQFVNAHAVENRGVGQIISYNAFTEPQALQRALQETLKPRFARRAKQLSLIFRDRQRTPLQTAIWHIEHIARHGRAAADLLQTHATRLPWYNYHSVDVLAVLLLTPLLIYLLLSRLSRFLLNERNVANKPPSNVTTSTSPLKTKYN